MDWRIDLLGSSHTSLDILHLAKVIAASRKTALFLN